MTYQGTTEEWKRDRDEDDVSLWADRHAPLWAIAAALKLGYVGDGVVARVARTIAECYWQSNQSTQDENP